MADNFSYLIKQLRTTLAKMEIALSSIIDSIVWTDVRGTIQWSNSSFDKLVHLPHIQVLGKSIFEILPLQKDGKDVVGDNHPCNMVQRSEGPIAGIYETCIGSNAYFLDVYASTVAGDKNAKTVIFSIDDITAKKRSQDFLEILQNVSNAANQSMTSEEAIQTCLDEICHSTRWPVGHAYKVSDENSDLLIPSKIWHLGHSEDFRKFKEVTERTHFIIGEGLPGRVLHGKKPVWIKDVTKDPNFPRANLAKNIGVKAAFAVPVLVDNEVVFVLEFFSGQAFEPDEPLLDLMAQVAARLGRVVVRQKVYEQEKVVIQTKAEADRMKALYEKEREFTSTVSHELRTPLASMKGSVDMLTNPKLGTLNEKQSKYVDICKRNLDRLHRLINDVLDLSKLELGKMEMVFEQCDVDNLIREAIEAHQNIAEKKGLSLKAKLDSETKLIEASRDKISQVLDNLINNAIKFTDQGNVIVSSQLNQIEQLVTICVQDTGMGISKQNFDKLFEKFQQLGESTQQVSGTGLGLAICKEIIVNHHGKIWVESQPGSGATFIIKLPFKQPNVNK